MRPSPTSPYGLIIQAPLMSHFIASYTRAGVSCCLKVDLSSSPHIPVEGESLITLDPNRRHSRLTSQDRSATTAGVSPPRGILIFITLGPAYLQGTSNWLQHNGASTYPTPKENLA
ncbi:hypothetical protein BgiBS90_003197 [Biomphalaria glabrata]|nr:hypothetical protein BgiBS90_003195 [Biomphalaria glabrata]KAI8795430.1 hypothetical protein BgiBS90_003197 [Biomphalaria glabrata]